MKANSNSSAAPPHLLGGNLHVGRTRDGNAALSCAPISRFEPREFGGDTYEPEFDAARLRGQLADIYARMSDGAWHTLRELAFVCGCSEASASARLRDLRKKRFGGHTIERRRVGDPKRGLFAYRMRRKE